MIIFTHISLDFCHDWVYMQIFERTSHLQASNEPHTCNEQKRLRFSTCAFYPDSHILYCHFWMKQTNMICMYVYPFSYLHMCKLIKIVTSIHTNTRTHATCMKICMNSHAHNKTGSCPHHTHIWTNIHVCVFLFALSQDAQIHSENFVRLGLLSDRRPSYPL